MRKLPLKIKPIDVPIYLTAIFLDSFGIAILVKTSFGATPFGIFVTSVALILPLSVGMISLVYELLYILGAALISKSRIKFELLVYSFIFAFMIDLMLYLLPDLSNTGLGFKIIVTLMAVVLIDVSKALFKITVFPKLSVVEFMYALVNRYHFRLDYTQKAISLFNVIGGLFWSFLGGKIFYNLGLGTLIAMISFGTVLHHISPKIEAWYQGQI